MLFERTYPELVGEMLIDLSSSTRLTKVSPGGKARGIIEIISRNINQAYKIFDLNLARAFLSGASGKYIDLIGEILNVPRLGIEIAQASDTAQIVKFFVNSGTFADINGGNFIIIPAGTIISSQVNSSGILYKVNTGVVLSGSASEQFISVEALTPGESGNVGANVLLFHNFTDYVDVANDSLKITNVSGIFNGSEVENDTNYKFRISKSALASESANQTSILLAVLSVPGVANVIMQNRALGIGTYKVLIKSVTPSVSANLIEQVQSRIDLVTAQGIFGIADRPDETGLSITISISYRNGISDTEKSAIEDQIRLTVSDYVNNLDIGEEFIINELVSRILSVSPNIKDIGKPNLPIDEITLFKETSSRDSKTKQQLVDNYSPAQTERVIIEPSLNQPVIINRN